MRIEINGACKPLSAAKGERRACRTNARKPESACIHENLKLEEKMGLIEDFVTHSIHECLHLVTRLCQEQAFKAFWHEDAMNT
jgi:hypothetical protein